MSVNFLAPWYLLAGLAVALPILIHLLQRRREVVLPFSMVRFVLQARRRSSRRLKLKRLLLLLLRMALVVLLALILSRPVVQSPASMLQAGEAGYTVVILDNSLSMAVQSGGRPRMQAQRELVENFVAGLTASERFTLVPAAHVGEDGSSAAWGGKKDFLTDLDRVTVVPGKGDFIKAFQEAYRLLREVSSKEKKIAVFTDLARGGWEDFSMLSANEADLVIPVRIYRIGRGAVTDGAGLLSVKLEGESRLAGEEQKVTARVVNWGPKATLKVELWMDGRFRDRRVLEIPPGEEGDVSFQVALPREGLYRGELRLEEDRYREDDRRYFGLTLSPPVRILLVDGDAHLSLTESETFFLAEALRSERLALAEPLAVQIASPLGLSQLKPEEFDVIILANVAAPFGDFPLSDFVAQGGGLVLFWGRNCHFDEYQRALPSLLPALLGDHSFAPEGASFKVGQVDAESEMFALFRSPSNGTFTTSRFRGRAHVREVSPGARVMARFEDGQPWILESVIGRGKVVLFTSTADLEWNDLPTKPVFVPLIRRTVLGVSGSLDEEGRKDPVAGEPHLIEGGAQHLYSQVQVTTPDGTVHTLEFQPEGEEAGALFLKTAQVGFYTTSFPGEQGVFAVNVPPAESDIRLLGESDLKSRFQQVPLSVFSVGEGAEVEKVFQDRSRSLSRPLFLALFFLVLVEMLIAGPRIKPAG